MTPDPDGDPDGERKEGRRYKMRGESANLYPGNVKIKD